MKREEIKSILEKAKTEQLICNITFKYAAHYWNLIPLICGVKLFLCAEEDDFILDGYSIRQYKDIKKLKAKNDKCDEILRKEGIVITIPEIDIESWHSVFQSLKKHSKNIIVEKEALDDNDGEFVIGRISEVYKNFAYVYHFDADGIWEDEPIKVPFSEITSVTFSSRYVDIFSKYIGEPNFGSGNSSKA